MVGPNEWRATVDHARRRGLMGASPGHHDAPASCVVDVICNTGAAGKVVAGVRSWPEKRTRSQMDKRTRVRRGALAAFYPERNDGTKGMNFV